MNSAAFRVTQLLYLMAPVYVANMAPPCVKFWRGWNRPISERLLGSHYDHRALLPRVGEIRGYRFLDGTVQDLDAGALAHRRPM